MLEKKKLAVELIQVQAARMSLELKIMEMEEEIKRLQKHAETQSAKEQELQAKINK